jgi:hypothetical protein
MDQAFEGVMGCIDNELREAANYRLVWWTRAEMVADLRSQRIASTPPADLVLAVFYLG